MMESVCGKKIDNISQAIDHATECCSVGRVREEPEKLYSESDLRAAKIEGAREVFSEMKRLHRKGTLQRSGSLFLHYEDICLGCSSIGDDEDDKGVVYWSRSWPCSTLSAARQTLERIEGES